jgi:dolichol-phosphate mannosyltransferase
MNQKKTIGIVVAIFNEEEALEMLVQSFQSLFQVEKSYSFKVYFVENGSSDSSLKLIREACQSDHHFSMIQLSRNFRMDGALTAGLDFVSEDACVLMAGDMQDPPAFISKFIREWECGYENVYGVITKRSDVSWVRRMNSSLFYFVAAKLSNNTLPRNASDFRLVDKKVYRAVREMRESNRFVRGLFAWSGFKSIGVPLIRPPRLGGVSKASTLKVVDLAIKGIFAHSVYPLKLITISGFFIFCCAILSFVYEFYTWIVLGVPFAGYGTIVSLLLLGIGIIVLVLGIISEYIGLIYEEVKNRPNFLVTSTINIDSRKNEYE